MSHTTPAPLESVPTALPVRVPSWSRRAVFYHLYPLGCLGAPRCNDPAAAPVARLDGLHDWLDEIQSVGANALYLGPVFESATHGYDTIDYRRVDRRLGDNQTLSDFARACRASGIRLVLDGVFHHVGRGFFAFEDVLKQGRHSRYQDWFFLDHGSTNHYGDPFSYQDWQGHAELVKLNTSNAEVRAYLFETVDLWRQWFAIDGLRLDAADALDQGFLRALAAHCRRQGSDFWLMGEVVHGDYRRWIDQGGLDSVTNYEAHKGLWSSHNDGNYFEIAHTLDRQSGPQGRYRDLTLYNFADNHDVDRVASRLANGTHLYPLHILLFSMPGIPSIYYGSEFGWAGQRSATEDHALRPYIDPRTLSDQAPHRDLRQTIRTLATLRKQWDVLRDGDYQTLHVDPRQMAFRRRKGSRQAIIAVNAASHTARLRLIDVGHSSWRDLLNPEQSFDVTADGALHIDLPPCWGRILVPHLFN